MKRLFCLLLVLLLCGCSTQVPPEETAAAAVPAETGSTVPATTEPTTEPTEPEPVVSVLTFAGDCTLGADQPHVKAGYAFLLTVGEDYDYPFRNVAEYFKNDDFTMVNLEGVLGDKGHPAGKKYAFRGPADYTKILTQNSVEMVSLANNHTLDYGEEGYLATKEILEKAGVPYVEANNSTVVTLENGLTIGIYGTVYNTVNEEKTIAGIQKLREQGVDLVIYAPHWGRENSFRPNQQQNRLGRAAIDAGADIVYGCHPHVLQPVEEYNDGVIYYSLGNFSFGGNMYPKDYDTVLIQQEVIKNADGTVVLGARTIVPCSISSIEKRNNFQPTPYEVGSAAYERAMSKVNGTYKGANLSVD